MKKLLLTVIAGSVCAVFGSAYAQSNPASTLPSDQGVKTPKVTDDNRMDLRSKGATDAKGGGATGGSSTTGSSSTSGTSGASSSTGGSSASATGGGDTGAAPTRKSRRAARREKG